MEPIKQTGLLFKFSEKDYVAGKNSPLSGIEVNPSGDWRTSLPEGEPQYLFAKFDTMSCTTFSATNIIETWCNWLLANDKLSVAQIEKVNALGYIKKGKFNFSDRFTAIMSGTMPQGNYFQAVIDSIRKDGLLPEDDFPFGGITWAEYHDKTKITQEMKDKAKKFLEIFAISYEWTLVDDSLAEAIKQCPIQVAIPAAATHAVELPKLTHIFDSYPPYLYERNILLAYAMKIFVNVIPSIVVPPSEGEIYKPKNFSLKELVSPEVYAKYGEKAWEFFDERILRNIQWVRERLGITYVNKGNLHYRGFDANEYRKEGTSQHNMGRALDFDVKGMTSTEVTKYLVEHNSEMPEPNCWVEKGEPHNHMDVRYSDKKGIYLFNA